MIDNKPIKETGKLTLVIYPTCRLKLDDQVNCGVVNGLSQGHVKLHGRDPDNRAPHVNRQLTVVLCILCIFTLAIHTVSILFRLSISGDTKSSRGNTQLRGRRNDVVAAPVPTRDHPKSLDTAPRSSSCDGVRGRGRKPSVEEITSPTLLNPTQGEWFKHYPVDVGVLANFEYDQVKAKTASAAVEVADDAYIHPSCNCISHESRWSTSEIDTTIAHPEVIVLPVGGQGSQRGSSSSIHQSSPSVVGSLKPVLLRPSYHSFPYFFQRFSSGVLAEYFWPSAGFSSYGRKSRAPNRNRILRLLSGRRPTLFLMVIAVDEAVRDLWVLDRALTVLNSESVHFMGLGGWVTLEDIKTGVKRLCEESKEFPDSQIVILLTGHGDERNKMMLPMSESIDASYLFKLLLGPHSTRPITPITILFDICRPCADPSPEPPEGITLIFACSPGEAAGAYRLPHGPDSCFLASLMMSSREKGSGCISRRPLDAVQIQLNHVTEYLKKLYSIKHSQEKCRWCSVGQCCFEPMSQNVDWKCTQNTDGLLMLMKALSLTEAAEDVYQWFACNKIFCTANNIPLPGGLWSRVWNQLWPVGQLSKGNQLRSLLEVADSGSGFRPLPEDSTSKHARGANESVCAR